MPAFDMIDLRILDVLQRKGRIASAAIAEEVRLSETACYNRLKKLDRAGVVTHYGARVNIKRTLPAQVFFASIWLEKDRATDLALFEAQVQTIPEIVDCSYITGSIDYCLRFVTADFDHYVEIMNSMKEQNSNIARWETSSLVREVKAGTVPLETIERARQSRNNS